MTSWQKMQNFNNFSEGNSSTVASENGNFSQAVNGISYCYVLPVIAVVGILGNVANLMTLANPKLKAVSYMYLRALGIADLLCMCFVLVFVFFEILKHYNNENIVGDYGAVWYRAHLMLPLINSSVSAGILTVVALTVERYISICFPTFFRSWNVPSRATMLIVCAYVIPFVLYIPMCWQMVIVPMKFESNGDVTKTNHSNFTNKIILWKEKYPELPGSGSQAYKWTRETLLKFIPIVSLTILNLQIILTFREVRKRRQRMLSSTNQNVREQRSLLILLAGIAILFFICNIPAAINLVFISDENKKLHVYMIFRAMANMMEILNHALNFYVFCLCSTDYRQTFLQTFPVVKNCTEKASKWYRHVGDVTKKSKTVSNNTTTSTVILTDSQKSGRQKQQPNCLMSQPNQQQQVTNGHSCAKSPNNLDTTAKVWQDANNSTASTGSCLILSNINTDNNDKLITTVNNGPLDNVHYIDDNVVYETSDVKRQSYNLDKNADKQTTMVIMNYCLDDEGADDVLL